MKRSKNVLFRLNDVDREPITGTLIFDNGNCNGNGFDLTRGESIGNVCIVGVVGIEIVDRIEIGVDDREK